MAFVNEYISPDDMKKYRLNEVDAQYLKGYPSTTDWTVDKDRGIYFRNAWRGDFDRQGKSAWTFFWRGRLLWVEIAYVELKTAGRGSHVWLRERITKLCEVGVLDNRLPEDLQPHRAQILEDLREALIAYRDGGVYATAPTFELVLEIAEGV